MKLSEYTVMIETLERWYQEAGERVRALEADHDSPNLFDLRMEVGIFKTALWGARTILRRHVPDAADLEKWEAKLAVKGNQE